jgi:hypothetical protein
MEEAVATEVQRRNLKLMNTDPQGGPSPKCRRLSEDDVCYPVCVCGQPCEEDILIINIDEETVRLLEEALSSCS